MSMGRTKQQAITRKESTSKKNTGKRVTRHELEDDVRTEAINEGRAARAASRAEEAAELAAEGSRDAQAELEAVDHDAEKTPSPEISRRAHGPAAATGERARALGQNIGGQACVNFVLCLHRFTQVCSV